MTHDCTTLFNELDILEIRLEELGDVVDKFIIVEANITHSLRPKPYNFEENKDRYKKFLDKIIYIKLAPNDFPTLSPWPVENHQRNCILKGLVEARPDDIVLMSDLDEIPRASLVKSLDLSTLPACFELDHSSIYLNRITKDPVDRIWRGTVAAKVKDFTNPQWFRDNKHAFRQIKNGGWHFSYCGGEEAVREKVQGFCHTEYAHIAQDESLTDRIKNHKDLLNRTGGETIRVDIDNTFPEYIQKNVGPLSHLIE